MNHVSHAGCGPIGPAAHRTAHALGRRPVPAAHPSRCLVALLAWIVGTQLSGVPAEAAGEPCLRPAGGTEASPPLGPSGAEPSAPAYPDLLTRQGYVLAWNDEFDDLSLGAPGQGCNWAPYFVGWNVRQLEGNHDQALKAADFERFGAAPMTVGKALGQSGRWPSRAGYLHEITRGRLALRGYPTAGADPAAFADTPYVAGMLSGQESFAQRYGYWETRLFLQTVSAGHHFAVWLLPRDNTWPPEIDLMETVGQHQETVFVNSLGAPSDDGVASIALGALLSEDWHVIGFEWTPTTMRWLLDGQVVLEKPNYINEKSLYFLMSWEIGGQWAGEPDATTTWPAEVLVDYVRIFRPSESQ